MMNRKTTRQTIRESTKKKYSSGMNYNKHRKKSKLEEVKRM